MIGSTSRPIGSLFMNDGNIDEIGIRITPPNLVYSSNSVSRWIGSGIVDKPIGDFENGRWRRGFFGTPPYAPYFAGGSVGINIHSSVIPEPAEYALVFGIFALAFVIVRRRFQKKGLRNGK